MNFIKQIKNTDKLTNQDTKPSLGLRWYLFKTDLFRLPGFYQINQIYWKAHDLLFPKQKWLTNKIGKSWRDNDWIIEMVIFESIKHFVEGEDCFNAVESGEPFSSELKIHYNWITKVLPQLEQEAFDGKEFDKYEELDKLKTEVMVWFVKNRGYFWT